jgi:hypothetical protein
MWEIKSRFILYNLRNSSTHTGNTKTSVERAAYHHLAGWRMANTAMRLAILAASVDAFHLLIDAVRFGTWLCRPFSKRRAALALRQPRASQWST